MKSTNIRISIWFLVMALVGFVACSTVQESTPAGSELASAKTTTPASGEIAITTSETATPAAPTPVSPTVTNDLPTPLPTATLTPIITSDWLSDLPSSDLPSPDLPTTLPIATNTPLPTPTATPTPTPIIPNLYVRGAHINASDWSPDSQWLAYWLSTDEDLTGLDSHASPGGMLHLLNSSSGESCALPQFRTTAGGQMGLVWEADNSLIVHDWEVNAQWQGQPCQPDSFVRLADPPSPPAAPDEDVGLSPDGRFRVSLDLQEETGDNWRAMLTVLRRQDGSEITAVTWRTQATFDEHDPGGEWLSPTQFYIRLADGGPLLLDANQPGQVINVQLDLFGLAQPAPDRGVAAIPGPAPDSFYLLLFSNRFGNARIQVYHASSGLVETLPYYRSASPSCSPDYQWLLMYEREGNDMWMRRLADVDGEWRLLGKEVNNNLRWNTDATEAALSQFWQVTWQTFPEGDVIGQWSTEPFRSQASGWSPDGRFLVVMGLPQQNGGWYRQALFLFERNSE